MFPGITHGRGLCPLASPGGARSRARAWFCGSVAPTFGDGQQEENVEHMTRMPRRPNRDELPQDELAGYDSVFDRLNKLWGDPGDFYGALLNCPPVAEWWNAGASMFITGNTGYTPAQREWCDMVVCQELSWNSVYMAHMPDAVAVGVRPAAIKALRDGRDEDLSEEELTLTCFVREVLRGDVSDQAFAGVVDLLGDRGVIAYAAFVTRLLSNERLMKVLGLDEPSDAQVDELLQGFLDGTAEIPDPNARIG
jgi:hypothetical protein